MEFFETIDKDLCSVNFRAKDKDDALRKIAEIASKSENLKHISTDYIFDCLKERESLGSTGFTHGIAIPHARIKGLYAIVSFVLVSQKGIDYNSLDKKKSNIFCVILAPEDKVNDHLKLLASFSRALNDITFKKELLCIKDSSLIYESFVMFSRNSIENSSKSKKMKLLTLILYYDELMYSILEFFIEMDIKGVTIMESSGMSSYISNIPVFASFLSFMKDDKHQSKTILVTFPDDMQDKIVNGIEKITGDLDKKQGAMIIITDIAFCKGIMQVI